MKTLFVTLLCSVFTIVLNAQYQGGYSNNNYNYHQDRYDRNNKYDRNNHRHTASYNYSSRGRYLPIQVRKELRRLERKLAHRQKCAWEDGHVSRREARRIRDVERDIAQLLYRYGGNRYTNTRSNRYCR